MMNAGIAVQCAAFIDTLQLCHCEEWNDAAIWSSVLMRVEIATLRSQ
jgi:hypothetical protein